MNDKYKNIKDNPRPSQASDVLPVSTANARERANGQIPQEKLGSVSLDTEVEVRLENDGRLAGEADPGFGNLQNPQYSAAYVELEDMDSEIPDMAGRFGNGVERRPDGTTVLHYDGESFPTEGQNPPHQQ